MARGLGCALLAGDGPGRGFGGSAIRRGAAQDEGQRRNAGQRQVRALPFLGRGPAPTGPEVGDGRDERGFVAILAIFARTWPYLLPHAVGYWREFPRRPAAAGGAPATDAGWNSRHVPPLVAALWTLGPLLGLAPIGRDWRTDLLLGATVALPALCGALLVAKGRWYGWTLGALALVGVAAFLQAVFFVDGIADNVYVGIVASGCVCTWVFQYRIEAGRLRLRFRVGSHLLYYFALLWASTLLTMAIALFSVDLVSQSILQAQPLTPFLADLIGQPELARAGEREGLAPRMGEPSAGEREGLAPRMREPGTQAAGAAAPAGEANIDLAPLTAAERQSLAWVYAGFMIFAWLAQIPATMFLPYYYILIMQRVNQDLRQALLTRWHRLSLRYHSGHRVGDSVYRLYQDSAQVTAVIGAVVQALHLLVAYGTGVVILAALDPVLGGLALWVLLLAVLWGFWYSPRMRTRSLAAREVNSAFTSRVQETFAAVRLIKAHGTGEAEQRRLERDSARAFDASYQVRSLAAVVGIVAFTLAAAVLLAGQFLTAVWAYGAKEIFASVLVVWVGLSFVRWNFSAYQSAQDHLGAASVSVRDLVERWTQAQDMAMGLNRVFDILDIEPDVRSSPGAKPMPAFAREIRFDRVCFAFEPGRQVLQDASFAAQAGTVTAIVGPTGSGKSSLMSLLFRLFDPDSGSIAIDGTDIRRLELESLRDNVAVALQENVLFGGSLRDNVRYVAPEASDARVLAAARVACLDEAIANLPEGLDTVLGDRGGKLSTGQRQRLSIARAVVKDAPILVLDEPTAALDAQTEHRVLERLADWGRGRAIFLITHRISTIRQAHRILYLDDGRIVENGTHEELMGIEAGRYRRFVHAEERLSRRAGEAQRTGRGVA